MQFGKANGRYQNFHFHVAHKNLCGRGGGIPLLCRLPLSAVRIRQPSAYWCQLFRVIPLQVMRLEFALYIICDD